jgi:hypothetical protein
MSKGKKLHCLEAIVKYFESETGISMHFSGKYLHKKYPHKKNSYEGRFKL